MTLQALSLGSGVDVWRPQIGAVHSAFEHALNLLMDGDLWTVLGVAQPDAPFGVRLAAGEGLDGLGVRQGDRVHVRAGYMRLGSHTIDCRAAARWAPTRWATPTRGLAARLTIVEREAQPRAWPGSVEITRDLTAALRSSDAELARALRRSVGRGPGLTPAGDDVLVGMLAVLTSARGPDATRLIGALAPLLPSTSDISRHLLQQAARGLPGRALHELGQALCEGVSDDSLAGPLASVLATGCTSGADACLGLAAACRLSFSTSESTVS